MTPKPGPAPDQRIGQLDHTRWASAAGRRLASLVTSTFTWSQANLVLAVTLVMAVYALTMGLSRVYLGHDWLTARAKHGEPRWNRMLTS